MPYAQITLQSESTEFALHWSGAEGGGNFQLSAAIPIDVLREQLRIWDEDSLSSDGKLFFYSEQLTREEANRMIRNTRRARNAVYGSDE